MFKFSLGIIEDIKREHDKNVENFAASLFEIEEHLEKNGYKVNLSHLLNHLEFMDDEKYGVYRKQILDFGNNIRREVELENERTI